MQRVSSLDGLRGIAAMVVVIYHSSFVPMLLRKSESEMNTAELIFSFSPIRIFSAGGEAVHVFFVLSGVVLGFVATSQKFHLLTFYKSRLIRLYLPVVPAVAISYLVSLLLYSLNQSIEFPKSLSFESVARDLTLLAGNGSTLGVLWSLTWEVWFSLLLPVFFYVASKRHPFLQLALCISGVMLGDYLNKGALQYLPMFLIGVVISRHWNTLVEYVESRNYLSNNRWTLILFLFLIISAVTSQYWLQWLIPGKVNDELLKIFCYPVEFVGVISLVILSGAQQQMKNFLSSRVIKWLGMISFSLYLIHSPIIEFIEFWQWQSDLLMISTAILLSIFFGWLFYISIEKPSHNLAKFVGSSSRI